MLRSSPHYRRECFDLGLKAAGFDVVHTIDRPTSADVLLLWNGYGAGVEMAGHFERHGAHVLVAENNPLGNDMHGGSYTLARRQVAMTGGVINDGGPGRWDGWGINLYPWRSGDETVILGQRGIGNSETRSPDRWAESIRARCGGRIRQHPGTGPAMPLCDDLAKAGRVLTWSSAAAIQALAMGVAVWHAHPKFVGAPASRSLAKWPGDDLRDDAARLALFRRMAWAIWPLDEIRSGRAIKHVLGA